MNPPMYRRVMDLFVESGLTSGFTTQLLMWNDNGDATEQFIVFRPNGGSPIRNDLGSDYYVMVDVIGAKGKNAAVDEAANAILDYIQQNPMPSSCIGHIENLGGMPTPLPTTEGRLVYRLNFACIYGE